MIEVLKVTKTTKTKVSIKVELIKKYNQIALRPTRAKQKDQNNLETGLAGSTKVGKVKGKGWVLTTLPWQLLIGTANGNLLYWRALFAACTDLCEHRFLLESGYILFY